MKYTKAVLGFLGVVYLLLGLWCFSMPTEVAGRIGLELVGSTGTGEFMVVYGGLELALGIFFILSALKAELTYGGVLLAVISSAFLFLIRSYTIVYLPDIQSVTYRLVAVELFTLLLAISAWFSFARSRA